MDKLFHFSTGTLGCYVFLTASYNPNIPPEIIEMIKALLSVVGGIISSIIINWINKKFNKTQTEEQTTRIKKELSELSKTEE